MKTSTLLATTLLVVSTLSGCKCGPATVQKFPKLEIPLADGTTERTSLDFNQVQLAVKSVRTINIRNGGNLAMTISKAVSAAPFAVESTLPLEVSVGSTVALSVSFTPTEPDQRVMGELTITSDDPSRETAKVTLAGQGITAVARVTPNPIDFGDVYIGETRKVSITMSNAGTDDLVVKGAAFGANTPGTVTATSPG